MKKMKNRIHAIAGAMAMLTVATFWFSTAIAELFLDHGAVAHVKDAIATYGVVFLVLAMAATGGSGFALSAQRAGGLVSRKKQRMRVIAANGLLVMIPCAVYLDLKAAAGEFDAVFFVVQAVELMVGLVQLTLMGRNLRDGLRLRSPSQAAEAAA